MFLSHPLWIGVLRAEGFGVDPGPQHLQPISASLSLASPLKAAGLLNQCTPYMQVVGDISD